MKLKLVLSIFSLFLILGVSCNRENVSTISPNQKLANETDRIVVDKTVTKDLVFFVPESFSKKYSPAQIRIEKFYIAKTMGYNFTVDSEMESLLIAEYKSAGLWEGRTATYPWEQDGPGMMCQNTTGCGCTAQMDNYLRTQGSCCMCYVRGPQMNCQLYIATGTACAAS